MVIQNFVVPESLIVWTVGYTYSLVFAVTGVCLGGRRYAGKLTMNADKKFGKLPDDFLETENEIPKICLN